MDERPQMQIAIDGPSGAGKSTLARQLASRLGLRYVDTGAMYRAVAWKSMQLAADSEAEIVALLGCINLQIDADPSCFRVRVDGEDVTALLRQPAIGKRASEVAQIPAVREWLVAAQRREAGAGAVLEGRDIGTVVLPDADLKLFVTAPEDVRMARRANQLGRANSAVVSDVRERDRRDRARRVSPLRPAADAVTVDTGSETPEESLARMLALVSERRKLR